MEQFETGQKVRYWNNGGKTGIWAARHGQLATIKRPFSLRSGDYVIEFDDPKICRCHHSKRWGHEILVSGSNLTAA